MKTNTYHIFTDALSDMPHRFSQEKDFTRISYEITLNGEERLFDSFDDRSMDELYSELSSGAPANTRALSLAEAIENLEQPLSAGKDVLCVTSNRFLSATSDQIEMACKMLRRKYTYRKIGFISSFTTSTALALFVSQAILNRSNGMDIDENIAQLSTIVDYTHHYMFIENIKRLEAGGRAALDEKRIIAPPYTLYILPVDGIHQIYGKYISKKQVHEKIVELISFHDITSSVFLGYASNKDEAQEVLKQIKSINSNLTIELVRVGPISVTHTGCGVIHIAFIDRLHKRATIS